jgi:hypothetical protein
MRKLLFAAPAVLLGLQFSAVAAEVDTLAPGTEIMVRTDERIDVSNWDRGRIYRGELARDLRATDGDVAFLRGTPVELTVRQVGDHDFVIDLEAILANGRRFMVDTTGQENDTGRRQGVGGNERTAKYVGGGAIIGSIIGAIAGGGKGAAIGAAAGAASGAGAQVATRGRELHIPPESLLTFRLERPLRYVEGPDNGVMRNGYHYHDYRDPRDNPNNYRDNRDDRRQ